LLYKIRSDEGWEGVNVRFCEMGAVVDFEVLVTHFCVQSICSRFAIAFIHPLIALLRFALLRDRSGCYQIAFALLSLAIMSRGAKRNQRESKEKAKRALTLTGRLKMLYRIEVVDGGVVVFIGGVRL
jgi:hypothetical protein